MTRVFALAVLLAVALATSAPAQQAQQSSNTGYRPRQPELWWHAGGVPPANAQPRLYPGEHGVGDVIAEIDLTPSRFGNLMNDVTVSDDRHGALTLPAQTRLRAYANRYIVLGDSRPARVIETGAQWCTLSDSANSICISELSAMQVLSMLGRERPPPEQQFNYEEYTSGLARQTGRRWRGPEPTIEEDPPNAAPARRQIVIRAISDEGVMVSLNDVTGSEVAAGPAGAPLVFGQLGPNLADFMGHVYSFAPVAGAPERAVVTFTRVPF